MTRQVDPRREKDLLRARLLETRARISDPERREASQAICTRIAALAEVQSARTLSIYWPLLSRHEVDTRPLIDELAAAGRRIAVPVVDHSRSEPTLWHRLFEGEGGLQEGRWGLFEPSGPALDLSEIDLIVAPAVGAGREGHRIGYGAGYYDHLLRATDAPAIAAVFSACLVEHVPHEPHDVAVDVIATEGEVIHITHREGRNSAQADS